jgi:predicted amidohydrolase
MSDLVIAAVQMTSGEDVEANLERSRELVREAATAGALIVGLPENFAYLGGRATSWRSRSRCRRSAPTSSTMPAPS